MYLCIYVFMFFCNFRLVGVLFSLESKSRRRYQSIQDDLRATSPSFCKARRQDPAEVHRGDQDLRLWCEQKSQ